MKLNYLLEGRGDKTIVFVHGLSNSLDYWRILSAQLGEKYRILLYDLRGHGKTPYSPFTMDLLVEDLHDLLLNLNISKASLAGLSLGGNVVLSFALKYPGMVEKLVLMSTFSEVDDTLKSRFWEFNTAVRNSYEEFYDVIMDYVLPEDILNENRELLEFYKKEAAKSANQKAIENGIDIGLDFYVTDKLKSISCPVLILAGKDDILTSTDLSQIMNDNIEDSRLVIFENTKHNLLINRNKSEIVKLMRRFI